MSVLWHQPRNRLQVAGRYESAGLEGLYDLPRAPHEHPNAVTQRMEDWIIGVREQHASWGAPKIRAWLQRKHPAVEKIPAESTIGEILKRNGLTVARKKRRSSRPASEPLAHATEPNTVWCADYKGWFRTQDGTRIDPLTIRMLAAGIYFVVRRWQIQILRTASR